jgi:endonuclease III
MASNIYYHTLNYIKMEFLKKLWTWILSQTTIDEQVEAKVAKITKEVSEVKAAIKNVVDEASDVVEEVKPKKRGRKTKS